MIDFRFKESHKPRYCKRPKDRPGSAKYKLLEAFAKDFLGKGLIKRNLRTPWANRALLVAKYALDAARGGVPDSLRFCLDLSNANDEIDMIPAEHGNVEHELSRVAGHKYYIQADSASAYWSFDLSERSKDAASVWLPHNGEWCLFSFQRLPMGSRNAATHMNAFYHRIAELNLNREVYSNLADDWVLFGNAIPELLHSYEAFLKMCKRHNVTIKPAKVKLLFTSVEYFGWLLDETGYRPSPRNLEPIRIMVQPESMSDLRTVLGFFNTFSKFLVQRRVDPATHVERTYFYKELVHPMSIKNMNTLLTKAPAPPQSPDARCAGKPAPKSLTPVRSFQECWGEDQVAAFEAIRELLLQGVHLFFPLND